jgi:peptidoglycan/xylan/chitin deacetylase (PgdA/CDA1 family)
MKHYLIAVPGILQRLCKKLMWKGSGKGKVVYLTFDDGPTPKITTWVLEQLELFNAKATFFCIGKNIVANANIVDQVIAGGHALGNHTFEHLNGWKTKTKDYLANCVKAQLIIDKSYGLSSIGKKLYFRPPYGKIRPIQARKLRKLNYEIVMWDVLSGDFDTQLSPEKCLSNVIQNVQKGSIVVFHDSIKAEERLRFTLPKVLEYFTEKGYRFEGLPI